MKQEQINSSQTTPDVSASNEGLGATIRKVREAKNFSLADASMRLKYSQRLIVALESEQWEILPQGMPLRGFVRNYARYLEIEPEALLSMLDNQVGTVTTAIVVSNRSTELVSTELSGAEEPTRKPWGWLLVILLFVIVAIFYGINQGWVPDSWLVFDWLKALK